MIRQNSPSTLNWLTPIQFSWVLFTLSGGSQPAAAQLPNVTYDHTITLSATGTPCSNGDNLQNTMDGILDAGPDNTYLVLLNPGVYGVCSDYLIMKSYVDIAGVDRPATIIRGYGSTSAIPLAPTILGADHTRLTTLTLLTRPAQISETPPGLNSIGLHIDDATMDLKDVTIISDGGHSDRGIRCFYASTTLTDVEILVGGRQQGWGLVNHDSTSVLQDVSITVTRSALRNIGIHASSLSLSEGLRMSNTKIYASGGGEDIGIVDETSYLYDETWLDAKGSRIHGDHYGIRATEFHTGQRGVGIKVTGSRVSGQINTIYANLSTLAVATSVLDGGPVVAQQATCTQVVDGNGDPYGPACESP